MKNPLYKAIVKSLSGRLSTYIVQFSALAIYARLFSPEEFGVIASIQVFVIFFQMLADVGIGPAIISKDKFSSNMRDGIFTVTAIVGALLAITFFFFSFFLNSFYGGYEYQNIAVLVCFTIFFSSLNIVPMTAMSKDAKFLHIAGVDVIAECLALGVVYVLYLSGGGVLALASRPVAQGLTRFLLIFCISEHTALGRPTFGSELHHIKSILSFSLYQFGFNFINYFSRNLDNILIAKFFGMVSVGIYEKAYQLMRYPLMVTTFAMAPAIQPILTKARSNTELVIKEHNLLTARLFALSLPISFFLYINSHNIILFLFGETWLGIEPLIKVFSFMIPIQAVLSTSGAFFQVMNQPRLLFFSGVISAFLNVAAISIGIRQGEVVDVASALAVSFSINFFIAYYILFKYCFLKGLKSFYFKLIKSFLVMIPSIVFYYIINTYWLKNNEYSLFVDLFINSFVGGASIVIFSKVIKKGLK
ncbi:oligosaccharide flippase family protein [Vibrio fluvialis]|nr:oligosaccharide flippase family protein [Vibrio fluvialis]